VSSVTNDVFAWLTSRNAKRHPLLFYIRTLLTSSITSLSPSSWSYRRGARHRDGHIHMSRIRRAEAQCARVVLVCAREELDLDGLGLPGGTLRPDTLTVKAVEFEAMTETRSRAVPVFLIETDSVAVVATLTTPKERMDGVQDARPSGGVAVDAPMAMEVTQGTPALDCPASLEAMTTDQTALLSGS
jgi:hypothetical protein